MQRFTVIHDGSDQGWQTAYLAIYVAARLGALLQVLLIDATTEPEILTQSAKQLEIAGRAAGVALKARIDSNVSIEAFVSNSGAINGLFLPNRLLPDDEAVARLLEGLSCPLWIVSEEPKVRKMAVLVESLTKDEDLIAYATILSQRMSENLTGLIVSDDGSATLQNTAEMTWLPLKDLSLPIIASALDRLQVDLLFIRQPKFSLVRGLDCACIIWLSGNFRDR